jgi:hypothetical protein
MLNKLLQPAGRGWHGKADRRMLVFSGCRRHGFPFPFVWQSVEKLDTHSFPRSFAVMLPQEFPTWVSFAKLSLNVALVGVVAFAVTGIQTMEAGAQIRMTSAALTSALTSFPARQPSIGCCLRKR